MSDVAAILELGDLAEGVEEAHPYRITEQVHASFLEAFGDRSPIHVDDDAARLRGFPSRVAHGAILNGFVSHLIGMRFPGASALLLGVELRYVSPSHVGDDLVLTARVAHRSESAQTVSLTLSFRNISRDRIAATGRALVRVDS